MKRVWRRGKFFLFAVWLSGCTPTFTMDLVDSEARLKLNEVVAEVNRMDANLEELNGRVQVLEVDKHANDTRG